MKQDLIRTYSELIRLPTFEERFEYLKLSGRVGVQSFGFERYLNQLFYHDDAWQQVRRDVILRDCGFDLAFNDPDYEIIGSIYVHHMNPIEVGDIRDRSDYLLNPEFLICTSYRTHQAIHYSNYELAQKGSVERTPFDTCPWRSATKGE